MEDRKVDEKLEHPADPPEKHEPKRELLIDPEAVSVPLEEPDPPWMEPLLREPTVDDLLGRPFNSSDHVGQLFAALAKAQGDFSAVTADKKNPHLKSRYASIGSYLDSVRGPMSKAGLAIIQIPDISDAVCRVETIITHESGEWISCSISAPIPEAKGMNALQAVGNALTYVRRYGLTSILCLAVFDSDGASGAAVADKPLTPQHAAELWAVAEQLFGDDADKELNKIGKMIFKVDTWAQIPDDMLDTAVEQLQNKAKAK